MYTLLEYDATVYFLIPYVSIKLILLRMYCHVSTQVCDSIMSKRIYKKCPISMSHRVTHIDLVVQNVSESSFVVDLKSMQGLDPTSVELKETMLTNSVEYFSQEEDGVICYQCCFCVPNIDDFRDWILSVSYSSRCSIHPGATKMYHDLRFIYLFNRMKMDITKLLSKCTALNK